MLPKIVAQKPISIAHEENNICLYRFSFHYAVNDLWEDAYTCPINAKNCTTESANLRYGTHGYEMDAYEGMAKIIDDVKVAVCPECGNIEMYLENLTNLKD
ncbi:MAG: hypothetical protein ACLR03_16260 [Roseburia inulinivorans]